MNSRFGFFYSLFVTFMVASLLVVFYATDQAYQSTAEEQKIAEITSKVSTKIALDNPVSPDPEEQTQNPPSKEAAPKVNQFAQRLLDGFEDATVLESVESVEGDDVLLKKEVLLTDMKYPLITREIRYRYDANEAKWIPVEGTAFVSDQAIVSLKKGSADIEGIIDDVDAEVIHSFEGGSTFLLRFRKGTLESLNHTLYSLRHLDSVDYAEPNFLKFPAFIPNDVLFSQMWGLNNNGASGGTIDADIDAVEAWDLTRGSSHVVVAVIDTGIDITHPDLNPNIAFNTEDPINGIDDDGNGFIDDNAGWSFLQRGLGSSDVSDTFDSHGTHVAGTIAARGNNQTGVIGVAPEVRILPVKVLDDDGGYISDYVRGLDYAAQMGAKILNISLGGADYSQSEQAAINRLEAAGILIVAASGNDGSDLSLFPSYPAAFTNENIISVLSTNRRDGFDDFSNYGIHADLGAPGRDILSTVDGHIYESYSGTSMATPHVSGVAALALSENPTLNAYQLKSVILSSVDPLPSLVGLCTTSGRLNAFNAVFIAASSLTVPNRSQIRIRSVANNQWVRPDPSDGAKLIADGTVEEDDQIFYVYITADGNYTLQSFANNLFVTAENGGEEPLAAVRGFVGEWEQFTPELQPNGTFSFRALANAKFVSAEENGDDPLIANRDQSALWEQFRIDRVYPITSGQTISLSLPDTGLTVVTSPTGAIYTTDKIPDGHDPAFLAGITVDGYSTLISYANSTYVTAENNGLDPLSANRPIASLWEQFVFLYHAPNQVKMLSRANQKYIQVNGLGQLMATADTLDQATVFDFSVR